VKHVLLAIAFFLFSFSSFAQLTISINAPKALLDTTVTSITITDVQQLLTKACGCDVQLNNKAAKVQIFLPEINNESASAPTDFSKAANFPYRHFPNHDYEWKYEKWKDKYLLSLSANSLQGVSFGLYGLLQEKLGFKFYHPRQMIIPDLKQWTLKENFVWQGKALFDKKGFHLHTQHPLELTEQLHDGTLPNALEDIKEYIDWLARNGQNYFEFCLLNSIDRTVWIDHAKNITDYVHQRGLIAAVDLSLHMIQQKTFQLYESSSNKEEQIEKNLTWLNKANWDVINMEFSTAEFISGNMKKKEELRQFVIKWIRDNSKIKLMGRQHVVRHENEAAKGKRQFVWDSTSVALDRERGVLSHTVMFYDMTEPHAPVYENENQRHMLKFMLDEHKIRETWYYPESAYWITFDNSVPMTLLPYLKARLADIDTCAAYKIPGHITFSSGWEWGYWLIDWSIARWSWQHTTNGKPQHRSPEMYAHQVLAPDMQKLFDEQLQLQQQYLKDSAIMQWMTAMTITDELGIKALANEYHPRPKTSYKHIRNKASQQVLNDIAQIHLPRIDSFANKALRNVYAMRFASQNTSPLEAELIDGLEVTAMRAFHRANILRYLVAKRESKLQHTKFDAAVYLDQAKRIRTHTQHVVDKRENHYRYSLHSIARKRWDHTAYHFGYLYPASNLHFWNREEQQAKRNQYRPLFMNIWSIARIIGLIK